jgi:hypothetical protein
MPELAPYTYDLKDPSTWRNFPAPPREEWFERELAEIGPRTSRGEPRHRLIWGDEERVYVKAAPSDDFKSGFYLKHHRCFVQRPAGFRFRDPMTKVRRAVKSMLEVPEGVSFITPLFDTEECGLPRWIVERWFDEGELGGAIGKSDYYPVLVVQEEPVDPATGMGPYRPPGQDTLETLRGMWQFHEKPEAEQQELIGEQMQRDDEALQRAKDAVWQDAPERWAKIVRDMKL